MTFYSASIEYLQLLLQVPIGVCLQYGVAVFCTLSLVLFIVSTLMTPAFSYRGKHVIVTGGSSGIGLEVAKQLVREGADVTIVARDKNKLASAATVLNEIAAKKGASGDKMVTIRVVSVDTGADQAAVTTALTKNIPVAGAIINCAGTSVAGPFEELDPNEFEHMLRVNLLGSVFPTRAVLPGMKAQGRGGRIVFVASQVAQVAIHGFTAYAASKWALRGLAEALQMEVKPHDILVSVVYPPDTDTPGYQVEMTTKPELTKKLSESGQVFSAESVAKDILRQSAQGYFGISTGLDGWLLKQLHPGMSPINNVWEVAQQIMFSPLARFISLFYLAAWDVECSSAARAEKKKKQ